MKIPKGYFDNQQSSDYHNMINAWWAAARKYSIEYGIFVIVSVECNGSQLGKWDYVNMDEVTKITFRVGDHEFESLKQLRTALKNKAFL